MTVLVDSEEPLDPGISSYSEHGKEIASVKYGPRSNQWKWANVIENLAWISCEATTKEAWPE